MTKDSNKAIGKKLNVVIGLLQYLLALELYKSGVKQDVIAKHLHVAKATVVKMLLGVKREN